MKRDRNVGTGGVGEWREEVGEEGGGVDILSV